MALLRRRPGRPPQARIEGDVQRRRNVAGAFAVGDLALVHPRPNPVAPPTFYTHRPDVLDALTPVSSTRVYSYDYSETGVAERRLGHRSAHTLARVPVGWRMDVAQALGMQMSLEPQTAGRWGLRQAFDTDYRGLQPESLARLTRLVRLADKPQHAGFTLLATH